MKVHFIGIGGIGISALARYYLSQARGHWVSGSDLTESEITKGLTKIGAKIFIGPHKSANLLCARLSLAQLPELVIYSPAVTPDNSELKTARKWGIKCQSYPEALGELTKEYFTIAVAGTHGKGTTCAMISLILIKAGFDPTVIIGTKLKEFGDSNFRLGKSPPTADPPKAGKILLIEADEYKSSFLNYRPKIIVLTCIDKDHLDYFKTLDNIVKAFKAFAEKLPTKENLIVNLDDKNSLKLAPKKGYSLKQKEAGILRRILKIPGDHIIADALAALTLARTLKIKDKISFKALAQYQGAWRRFEQKNIKVSGKTINLINDYAHHPTEIEVTLKAVRQKHPKQKITCVFQPHQYQRTFYLFKDFVKVLAEAEINSLILTDIYNVSGRES
ncbi:Mur ligase domain-containing protein, partial [Candidatus Parcubacteria bacterium]|nr:UDP-N-acetylmuramate--L-alanine ligase [Patescibacteria group bacterium]MBU4466791.1 UDP-N-acetylmuramate--L-alanine ligase [Patescibacteria group bacterium]MCG2688373.1 Mur ligase domain-containing protein [Candidatus Parcubacteria bacterium]